ncbi:folylpolyglutamate synthase/dihydrofolate synthase, partial [Brucella abortus bv. 5 str. B3196]
PSSDAGIANTELALSAEKAGLSAEPVHSVANALKLLHDTWPADEAPPRILIGGSLYLAGEVLRDNDTPPQ